MARFLPFLPPRSASFRPQRLRSQSTPNGPENVLRSLHQQRPQIRIAFLADVHLRFALSGVSSSWLQPQITAHVAALAEAMRIFQRQQEGQRDQRAHPLDLPQQRHLRVTLLRQFFDPLVIFAYLLTERLQCRPAAAPARFAVPGSGLRLSPDSYSARYIRAAARRSSWPVHEPC